MNVLTSTRARRASALTFVGAVVLFAACGGTGSGGGATSADAGHDGAVSSEDGGGGGIAGLTPPSQTGIALVDRLGAAAAACGKLSSIAVPGGWQNVAIGDKGCMAYVPPGWIVSGSGTGLMSAFADDTGVEGFVGLAGTTQDTCTPAAVRDQVYAGYTSKGYDAFGLAWHWEGQQEFGGTAWNVGHSVFTTSREGTPIVGYLWILALPTVAQICDVVGLGFWEPQARVDTDTCTTLQALESIRCPSGGGCDPLDCDLSCKNEGKAGGECSSGCSCY
jgi:hypothetical protein